MTSSAPPRPISRITSGRHDKRSGECLVEQCGHGELLSPKVRQLPSLILLTATLVGAACNAAPDEEVTYTAYPTKFGSLEFMRPSHDLRLKGTAVLKSGEIIDPYGYRLNLLEVESFPAPSGEVEVVEQGKAVTKRYVDRIVVAEAVDGSCARSFRIIDLRGAMPSISERFGLNPKGTSCLKFKRAKWGTKESYLYLEGSLKYIYYTGGKVIGPIE